MSPSASDLYQVLDHEAEIRLLTLTVYDEAQAQLCGHLKTFRMEDCPPYTALSHVWGDNQADKPLRLNNGNVLHITETLLEGLQHLRPHVDRTPVWVDKVCINQEDLDERAKVVATMDRIYHDARQVIAWLGTSSGLLRSVLNLLSLFGESHPCSTQTNDKRTGAQIQQLIQDMGSDPTCVSAKEFVDISRMPWSDATTFVKNAWFERLWVVQEIYHARHLRILCGEILIEGDVLFKGIEMISLIKTFPLSDLFHDFRRADQLRSMKSKVGSLSPLYLAHNLRQWECLDDRDRLNALASILHRTASVPWFVPTYSVSVDHFYAAFARDYIMNENSLDILHYAGDSRALIDTKDTKVNILSLTNLDTCSWVPDWRIKVRPEPFCPNLDGAMTGCHQEIKYSFSDDSRVLTIPGCQIDEILFVGVPLVHGIHESIKLDGILRTWYGLASKAAKTSDSYCLKMRFASTLLAQDRQLLPEPAKQELPVGFEEWASRTLLLKRKERPLLGFAEDDEETPHELDRAIEYGVRAMKMCECRSFFITKAGRFGLGLGQICSGWRIYYLKSLATPFVLQQVDGSSQTGFVLRGECFVEDFSAIRESYIRRQGVEHLVDLILSFDTFTNNHVASVELRVSGGHALIEWEVRVMTRECGKFALRTPYRL